MELCLWNQSINNYYSTGGGTGGSRAWYGRWDETWGRGKYRIRQVCDNMINSLPTTGSADPLVPYLKTITKGQSDNDWTDKPSATTYSSMCRTQQDTIFIPSYKEIFGGSKYKSNQTSNEDTCSVQYTYYVNHSTTTDRKKYRHSSTGTAGDWWTRSFVVCNVTSSYSNTHFCYINTSGNAADDGGNNGRGFVPCFCV